MEADHFFQSRIDVAKNFGFPKPIFINTATLTNRTRVIYIVEVQATHIGDTKRGGTHHFSLKFSKFTKIKEEPYWVEEDLTKTGFSILDKASIEKLDAYIKANQALLGVDILSKHYTSVILSNDDATTSLVKRILSVPKNKDIVFDLFKEQYPELDQKVLIYKLVQSRKKALEEFKASLADNTKNEVNYWQPFLEKNRWMFGLSLVLPVDDTRIDIWDTADFLSTSSDGFVDIVEIKHPFIDFWQLESAVKYKRYRKFLQPSEEVKGAISQATNYIFQLEKKFGDVDWQRKNKIDAPVKPTCTVIVGRSSTWNIEERTAFRLLNDSLHGIQVISFDHLYDRALKLLDVLEDTGS